MLPPGTRSFHRISHYTGPLNGLLTSTAIHQNHIDLVVINAFISYFLQEFFYLGNGICPNPYTAAPTSAVPSTGARSLSMTLVDPSHNNPYLFNGFTPYHCNNPSISDVFTLLITMITCTTILVNSFIPCFISTPVRIVSTCSSLYTTLRN